MAQPSKTILMIAIEAGAEALALRAAAEELFLRVELYQLGEARDLPVLLNGRSDVDLTLLLCHGDGRGGIPMPELAPGLAVHQPFLGSLQPAQVYSFLRLEGQRILSTGCSTGGPVMAQAFLDAGCEWYLAPDDDPDGSACFLFTLGFLYHHLVRNRSAPAALAIARRADDESRYFQLFER
jgi:hypothetical protein